MLADEDVRRYIGVNRYQSVLWFSKERFEDLLWWLRLAATILAHGQSDAEARIARIDELLQRLARAAADSEYQLEQLMALATAARPAPAAADRPARL
jgi:hypothetical protein